MAKPNILVLMVDQLAGTLFPDGPAEWLHAPNLTTPRRPLPPLRHLLHRRSPLRPRPGELHVRPAAAADAGL